MLIVMAKNEQLVFQDFLRLDCGMTSNQQQQQQVEECYTSATTTTTSNVLIRATLKSNVGFDFEGDVRTTRGSYHLLQDTSFPHLVLLFLASLILALLVGRGVITQAPSSNSNNNTSNKRNPRNSKRRKIYRFQH
jgi:hypothetical protein